MMKDEMTRRKVTEAKTTVLQAAVLATAAAFLVTGCTTKKYVRSQTAPIVQQTNELDARTAADHRAILSTDERAQKGIAGAMSAANAADQHAMAAGQAANAADQSAQNAVNRVDTLTGVVANLDNYKQVADVTVTFGFDKATLTASDRRELDNFASTLGGVKSYILEVTGGTDSTGSAQYNYQLSQRRADAVVNYLLTKYGIPPHKFYLIGIGKDQEVASNRTSAGRAKNRRVEVQLMSNMTSSEATVSSPNGSGQ